MSTLLVDNYDSYTYNVFHLLAAVSGEEPIVVHNDTVSWKALSRWQFDAIVLSPGPGRPQRWHDFGVCADILRYAEAPVLGICLGHQGIGSLLSGSVGSAPIAMHGRRSRVYHDGSGLFAGIPQGFSVVRYHSLAVTGLGSGGRVTAWTEDGVVMGIEHRTRPLWGVQFHPESVATEHGRRLIENFYERQGQRGRSRSRRARSAAVRAERPCVRGDSRVGVRVRSIAGEAPAELLFERLFGKLPYAFWLDSADAPSRLAQRSYLGTSAGAERCVLEYDVTAKTVVAHRAGASATESGSIFDVLERELAARACRSRRRLAARADRRLRRLSRLRVQGRLRLAERAPLRPAGRRADARQPSGRGRSPCRAHRRDRRLRRGRQRGRELARAGRGARARAARGGRRSADRPARSRRAILAARRSASTAAAVASSTSPTSRAARPRWRPASPTRSA